MNESHVEHSISFVEDEDLDASERDMTLTHEVEEPSGGRDEDVESATEGGHLTSLGHSTENDGVSELEVSAVRLDTLADLCGELASRSEDEHTRPPWFWAAFVLDQVLQNRQRERGGLSRTRLGGAEKVTTCEHGRDRLALDRRRLDVLLLAERALDLLEEELELALGLCQLDRGTASGSLRGAFAFRCAVAFRPAPTLRRALGARRLRRWRISGLFLPARAAASGTRS